MTVRIVGIIQARMGSERLPGKVMLSLAGRSVLGWVIRAAQESGALDDLVVATSWLGEDAVIAAECERLGVACHRGPVDDVLTRFTGALYDHPGEAVMRFTADCPLLDPELVALAADVWRTVPGLDYLSTGLPHTIPRGMDVEIVSTDALRTIDQVATDYHRVHVTSYAYAHPSEFRLLGLTLPPDTSELRVTLDTEADWELIQEVAAHFGDKPVPLRTLTTWLDLHPEVRLINAGVRQKAVEQA